MTVLSSPKRGGFCHFFLHKIENQLSEDFEGFFFIKLKSYFSRIPSKISALRDKQISSYAHFKRPKKVVFLFVFGRKIKTQFSKHSWKDFFSIKSKNFFFRMAN
jgi:hypothetical protein